MNPENKAVRGSVLVPVFVPAVVVTGLLVIGTISNPDLAGEWFSSTLAYITETFGWFYMLAVAIFLVFMVCVGFSKWGNIKLGPDHAEPQYSFPAWFAMLFSAGYGIALLFYGVAEPVLHYADPPSGEGETIEAAKQAMQIAYFHWGFHIWGIYGLVGLVLAYFSFRQGLPLSIRSALYPLVGDKIYGPIGHTVDVFAILGTLFGVATTLGLSVAQINAGVNYLWEGIPVSTTVQIIFIAAITLAATGSVLAGMDKGIKNLSMLNMGLAVALMAFVFIAGPSILILETFMENTGRYLGGIVERTFNLQAYESSDWIGSWTLFIFGWTIAWAPFVGMFIAKISRGRTIRQFVFGVLMVPTIFTFLWFSIFGDTALNMIMNEGMDSLIGEVQDDQAVALFRLLDSLPFSFIISLLTVFLITTFFVTSSDSASMVIDSLAAGGMIETPVWQRVFWCTMEGVVASTLLLAGGLSALQTMSVVTALPFAIIMLIACAGLWRALVIEGHREASLMAHMQSGRHMTGSMWKKRLAGLMQFPKKDEVNNFIQSIGVASLREVEAELKAQDWNAEVFEDPEHDRVYLTVHKEGEVDFIYDIRLTSHPMPSFAFPEMNRGDDELYYRAEVYLRRGGREYDVFGYGKEDVIKDIVDQFHNYLHFLHISPDRLPWDMDQHDEMLNPSTSSS